MSPAGSSGSISGTRGSAFRSRTTPGGWRYRSAPIRTGAPADVGAIADLVREHGVTLVVVGHPLLLSGEAGERAHHAERFAAALTGLLEIPVLLQDERLSTVEAERALRQTGASGRDRRRAVDRSAATVILQAWLDTDRPG